jgi:hypothetical protein
LHRDQKEVVGSVPRPARTGVRSSRRDKTDRTAPRSGPAGRRSGGMPWPFRSCTTGAVGRAPRAWARGRTCAHGSTSVWRRRESPRRSGSARAGGRVAGQTLLRSGRRTPGSCTGQPQAPCPPVHPGAVRVAWQPAERAHANHPARDTASWRSSHSPMVAGEVKPLSWKVRRSSRPT